MTDSRPKIAVVLEGGLVQCIVSDAPEHINADFVVIDYDRECASEKQIAVPQSDGSLADAVAYGEVVAPAEIDLKSVFQAVEERGR